MGGKIPHYAISTGANSTKASLRTSRAHHMSRTQTQPVGGEGVDQYAEPMPELELGTG